jgi:hypothetical protein
MKAKIVENLTWHCCMCCNPANGRVEFEDVWLKKPSFITIYGMIACQLTRTKLINPKKSIALILICCPTKMLNIIFLG